MGANRARATHRRGHARDPVACHPGDGRATSRRGASPQEGHSKDPTRFDGLVRSLAQPTSRRRTLGVLVGGVAALGLATTGVADAKQHRRQSRSRADAATSKRHAPAAPAGHKSKHPCQTGLTACTVGKKRHRKHICVDLETDAGHCGTCKQACENGEACQQGSCGAADPCASCKADQVCCNGACVDGECCDASGCAVAGETCKQHLCVCPSGVICSASGCCSHATDQCDANDTCCVDDGTACDGARCGDHVLNNCGQPVTCGVDTCAGFQTSNSNVTCNQNGTCSFSCQGEHYDLDGDPSTGCEVADDVTGNHIKSAAVSLGDQDCFDTSTGAFSGTIYSDGRVHETPAIDGFDATTGAAPDWFVVHATGGLFCQDNLNVTIKVTSGTPECYKLSVLTDKNTFTTQVGSNGTATITQGQSSYSDGANIYFQVEKTCGTEVQEAADYSVQFNL